MRKEKIFENNTEIKDIWIPRERGGKPPKSSEILLVDEKKLFKNQLLEAVKATKNQIFLCSFLLADEDLITAIEEAANRGVRVYLMMSSEVQLGKEEREDMDYNPEHVKYHKEMLRRLESKMLIRDGDHLHAKMLITDPFDGGKGFLSTANFTTEALERNQEIGVVLPSVQEAFSVFRYAFWCEAKRESDGKGRFKPIKNRDLNIPVSDNLFVDFSNRRELIDEILSILNDTNGKIFLSTFGLDLDTKIFAAIKKRAQKDPVKIFIRPRNKNLPAIQTLAQLENIEILGFRWIHAKFILAPENKRGVIMTANFDQRLEGVDPTFEIGVKLSATQVDDLQKIVEFWMKNAECIYRPRIKYKDISENYVLILKDNRLEELQIRTIEEVERPQQNVDLRNYIAWKNSEVKLSNEKKHSRKIKIIENYSPMRLPEKAIRVEKEEKLTKNLKKIAGTLFTDGKTTHPLFIHKGKLYYALKKEKLPDIEINNEISLVLEK